MKENKGKLSLHIRLEATEPELLHLSDITKRGPELIDAIEKIRNCGAVIGIQADRLPTARTDEVVLRLKPSEGLMELICAARAREVKESIS
jgi:hypothetical protein